MHILFLPGLVDETYMLIILGTCIVHACAVFILSEGIAMLKC